MRNLQRAQTQTLDAVIHNVYAGFLRDQTRATGRGGTNKVYDMQTEAFQSQHPDAAAAPYRLLDNIETEAYAHASGSGPASLYRFYCRSCTPTIDLQ